MVTESRKPGSVASERGVPAPGQAAHAEAQRAHHMGALCPGSPGPLPCGCSRGRDRRAGLSVSILQTSKRALGGEVTSGLSASPSLGSRPSWDLRRARPPAGGAVAPWSEASPGTGAGRPLCAGRGGARRGARPPGLGLQVPSQSPPPAGTLPSLGRRSHHSWPEWGPRRGLAWLLSAFRGPGPAGDTSGRGAGYRGASAVVAALREGVRQWERVLKSSVRPSSCHSQTRLGHTLLLWAPTLPRPSYPGDRAWAGAGQPGDFLSPLLSEVRGPLSWVTSSWVFPTPSAPAAPGPSPLSKSPPRTDGLHVASGVPPARGPRGAG